jgi:hypothetical protein
VGTGCARVEERVRDGSEYSCVSHYWGGVNGSIII